MSEILISIITPCYNTGEFIEETIKSVSSQSSNKVEHIIIDGLSTDNTSEILNKYKNLTNFKFISEKDAGIYDALNKGIAMAKGKYIGWLNADDVYVENIVNKVLELLKNKNTPDMFSGDGQLYQDNFNVESLLKNYNHYRDDRFIPTISNLKFAHLNCCFMAKHIFEENGEFDSKFKIAGDREYMLRMMKKRYTSYYLDSVVCKYRMHDSSLTFSKINILTGGAFLPIDHPVRAEIIKIAKMNINFNRDLVISFWAVLKILKYSMIRIFSTIHGHNKK
jgi:glycosyltransferase